MSKWYYVEVADDATLAAVSDAAERFEGTFNTDDSTWATVALTPQQRVTVGETDGVGRILEADDVGAAAAGGLVVLGLLAYGGYKAYQEVSD